MLPKLLWLLGPDDEWEEVSVRVGDLVCLELFDGGGATVAFTRGTRKLYVSSPHGRGYPDDKIYFGIQPGELERLEAAIDDWLERQGLAYQIMAETSGLHGQNRMPTYEVILPWN